MSLLLLAGIGSPTMSQCLFRVHYGSARKRLRANILYSLLWPGHQCVPIHDALERFLHGVALVLEWRVGG
jgi:hypothetical protein